MKELTCKNLQNVEEITDQCKYDDEFPGGHNDWLLVSCCQDNGYNELYNKLTKYRNEYNVSDKKILKAMCECCNKYEPHERTHEKFDECVEKKLRG